MATHTKPSNRGSEGEPAPGPLVSVVVLGESRRPFFEEAIASVLSQDLPRPQFELLVVKGFREPALDDYLSHIGAISIFAPGTSVAVKIALAVEKARGPVLALLDDDDVFEPNKLRAIVDAFHEHPGLGYFRNGQKVIGADGRPIPTSALRGPSSPAWRRVRALLIEPGAKERGLERISVQRPDFNDSSLAIRRDLAEVAVPYLRQLGGRADTLLFFVSACADCSILLDPRPLTRYRVHEENLSLASGMSAEIRIQRLVDYARAIQRDYRIVREFVEKNGSPRALRLIDGRIAISRLILACRSIETTRGEFGRLFLAVLRFSDTYPVREDRPGVVASLVFLLSPNFGRAMYFHLLRARV